MSQRVGLQSIATLTLFVVANTALGLALSFLTPNLLLAQQACAPTEPCVLTQHNDIGRTGLNPNETVLTPQNISSSSTPFGKLFTLSVDGQVMAQPLYYHGVVFVATQGGSVYAFDATTGAQRWRAVLIPVGETQGSEVDYSCYDISTIRGTSAPVANQNIGITSTPVIDDSTGTLYAVVRSKTTSATPIHYFRLHALDTTTGAEKLNSPVVIQGTVSGSGAGSVGASLSFDASVHHQRAGVLNVNGKVYIAFAGLCDYGNYHGWVMTYRVYDGTAASLTQTSVFVTSPNAYRSGIWMSGAGLAADLDPQSQSERIYPVTGNGPSPTGTAAGATCNPIDNSNPDYRDSILQLTLNSAGALTVSDFFTPTPELTSDTFCNADQDVGSGGALLLPYSTFPQPLLVQQGKSGAIYVLNREQLGTSSSNGTQTLQPPIGGFPFWGVPAYWNSNIYVWGAHGALTQYQVSNAGTLSQTASGSNQSTYGIGTTPSVSSTGNTNAIVWAVDWNQGVSTWGTPNPEILYAYDATNVGNRLWSSAQNANRDSATTQQKFAVPTIAAGEVFLPDGSQVQVYGLLNRTPQTISFTAPTSPVTYPVAPVALSASSTSGLTVTFSVLSGPATISGATLTITGGGTVVVAASQAGNSAYAPAPQVTQTITVNPGSQTISFTIPSSLTYPASPITLNGTATSGLMVNYSVISGPATVSGATLTITGAGTVVVAANQGGDSAYASAPQVTQTITVNPGSQTISFTAPSSLTYPASPITLNGTATSGLMVFYSVISGPATVSGATLTITGAGTVVVAADQAGNANYNAALEIQQTIVVSQGTVISAVIATGIAASTATITWTTNQPATTQVEYGNTASYGSIASGDGSLSTSHYLTLAGLTAGTAYNYAAMSTNGTGASAVSQNFIFTTETSTATPGPPVLAANPAIPANLQITAFATGLNYPNGMYQLPDGSLLVATSNPANNVLSGYSTSTLQVYRITTTNGVAGAPTLVFGGSAGPATSMAGMYPLVAIATGANTGSQILILQADSQGTLTQLGSIVFTYPAGTWEHDSHAVALRGVPGQAGSYQLIFGVGSQANNIATPASVQVGTSGMISQSLVADSLYSVQFSVAGSTINAAPATQLANGLRNPFALSFAPNGDGYLADNGQDVGLTNVATSADAFDVIPAGTPTILNFGFPNTFADPVTGLEVGPTTGVTSPIAAFVPLNGQNSQGIAGMALSPTNFPASLSNGLFLGFFGAGYGFGSFWNPVIYLNPATGQYFHFIEGGQFGVGPLISMLSTDSALYIADFGTTGAGGTIYAVSLAPTITSVTATPVSPTTAAITWTTDQASTTQVSYGTTTAYGSQSALASAPVTAHSVTLTGLTPLTTYNFEVMSTNGSGASSTAGNFIFATPAAPPVTSGVTATSITATSAVITWITDQASSSQVSYGTTTAYGTQSTLGGALVTSHSVALTGLTASTVYDFEVLSTNGTNSTAASTNFTFTTTAPAPVISGVAATGVTTTSATITWTTDEASSSQVSYGTTTAYGSQSTLAGTLVTSHLVSLTGLTPATTYDYQVLSTNSSGTMASSANFTFTTTTPAPVITAVTATGIAPTAATITWTTDQASSSQVVYGTTTAYGSQSTLAGTLVTSHSVTLTGLSASTTYNYEVLSTNGLSTTATSVNFTFTTVGPAPVSTSVTATGITTNSATITWTTDQASSSQVAYGTTAAYGSQSTLAGTLVTSHSVTLTGLTPSTTYDYEVLSTNGSGVTGTSANFTFTTTSTAPPPIISSVAAWPVGTTTATILWATDQNATSVVNYGLTLAYGSQASVSGPTIYHAVPLSGLTPGTTYNFSIVSTTGAGGTATSANFTFTTSGTAPFVISAVTVTGITSTSATINWTTGNPSTTQVYYGATASYGLHSPLVSSLVTTHSVTLTGLNPGTTYNYAALSTDNSGNAAASANSTFATLAGGPPPVISAVTATGISSTTATITWTTDQASSSQVSYGTTTGYGSQSTLVSALATSHSVTLTGLTPSTTYDYEVLSTSGGGAAATSTNYSFATSAAPAPVVTAVTATGVSSTTATITWTTDQASSSQVSYGTTTGYGSQSTLGGALVTSHSVTLTGLTPSTAYDYEVLSTNGYGTTATSANFTFTTSTPSPPPVISGVTAAGISSTTATITWATDQASSSQVSYGTTTAYGSQTTAGTLVTSHSVTLTGLTPSTTYDYEVLSTNGSDVTGTSANFTFTTTATAPPPVISSVAAWPVANTTATILWATDQNATSVVNYGLTMAYGSQASVSGPTIYHAVPLSGLTPGTTYNFSIVSTTGAGGTATSANFTFTTSGTAPFVISAVTVTGITSSSATINWTTGNPSTTQVYYGATATYGLQSPLVSTLVALHSITLTGLNPGTTYNYAALSTDNSGNAAASANSTFATLAGGPPPVVSAVTATGISSTTATITWTTDQASSSQVSYGTTTAYGSQSTLVTTLVTSHSVTLTGLTPSTTYDYEVLSTSGGGAAATSTNFTFSTSAAPAPVITGVTATGVSSTTATITWTTDQASSSQVSYGTTTSYGSQSTRVNTLVTSHSVTLTGLSPSTTYDFDVSSSNSGGTTATSGNFTFSTSATQAPVITGVTATGISATTATITWTTDQTSSSQVSYGTTTSYGSQSTLAGTLVTSHSVTLSGLTPSTTYDYEVLSTNGSGVTGTSANFTFTTTSTAPPPVISSVAAWPVGTTTATILWATDQNATSVVNYGLTMAYGSQASVSGPTIYHAVPLSGLTPGTTYNFSIVSTTGAGGTATSANFTFTTSGTAPFVISAVTVTGITSSSATINWTTGNPSTTQVYYGATASYGLHSPLVSSLVTTHSVTLTGLNPGTTYNYAALSTDNSGNAAASANSTFATLAGGPPPVISAVTATGISSTTATITWTTDQASSSQVSYGTTTGYGSQSTLVSALATSHSVTLTGLTPSTTYDYEVLSTSGGGAAATSTNYSFATSAAPAPVITAVTATGVSSTTATITWTTDQASSSQVSYGTTTGYGSQSTLGGALVTSHSVTLTGLTPSTAYDYEVLSTNGYGTTATSANFTFTTSTPSPPPVISGVTAAGISSTTATITWATDQASSSQVAYGTTPAYGSQSTLAGTLVTSHSVTLTGLSPSTAYDFDVSSSNSGGTTATFGNFTFSTSAAPAGPASITGKTCSYYGYSNSASCTWSSPPVAGESLHCFLFNFSTTNAFSVTDNAGTPNTYTQNGSIYAGTGNAGFYALFDALTVTDGSLTSTTASVAGSGVFFGLSCFSTKGGGRTIDGGLGTGSAKSGSVSATVTPTGSTDLGWCGVSSSGSLTPALGYTAIAGLYGSPTTSMYRILGAAGSQTASATITSGADIICATYE